MTRFEIDRTAAPRGLSGGRRRRCGRGRCGGGGGAVQPLSGAGALAILLVGLTPRVFRLGAFFVGGPGAAGRCRRGGDGCERGRRGGNGGGWNRWCRWGWWLGGTAGKNGDFGAVPELLRLPRTSRP